MAGRKSNRYTQAQVKARAHRGKGYAGALGMMKHKKTKTASKVKMVLAIAGTGGVISRIAENMGIAYGHVQRLLDRPDWADVREAYIAEVERGTDTALTRLLAIIERGDEPSAVKAATWLLSKRRAAIYGDNSKLTLEGGASPIKVANLHIPIESLGLSIEHKRAILAAMEAREATAREAEEAAEFKEARLLQ